MSQRATPPQLRAMLAFEAACERLRNTLNSPGGDGRPPAGSAEQQEAYGVILEALEDVRDAYGIYTGPPRLDRQDEAHRRGTDGP